jgi:hypothetical protein
MSGSSLFSPLNHETRRNFDFCLFGRRPPIVRGESKELRLAEMIQGFFVSLEMLRG